jgi:hypothetical protein
VYPTSIGLCESELKMIDNFQCFLCEKPVDFKKEGKLVKTGRGLIE